VVGGRVQLKLKFSPFLHICHWFLKAILE